MSWCASVCVGGGGTHALSLQVSIQSAFYIAVFNTATVEWARSLLPTGAARRGSAVGSGTRTCRAFALRAGGTAAGLLDKAMQSVASGSYKSCWCGRGWGRASARGGGGVSRGVVRRASSRVGRSRRTARRPWLPSAYRAVRRSCAGTTRRVWTRAGTGVPVPRSWCGRPASGCACARARAIHVGEG